MIRGTVWRLAVTALTLGVGPTLRAQPPVRGAPAVTTADIRFMQEMLGHHRQAVEMTALVRARTRTARVLALAERIAVSQTDELAMMRQWLVANGVAPDTGALHHMKAHETHREPGMGAMALMPGMLSPIAMRALRAARGARFDQIFLDGMIRHHLGALTMVEALLATPGAAQESSINRFVTDVDTDQRAEIARMRRMVSGQ